MVEKIEEVYETQRKIIGFNRGGGRFSHYSDAYSEDDSLQAMYFGCNSAISNSEGEQFCLFGINHTLDSLRVEQEGGLLLNIAREINTQFNIIGVNVTEIAKSQFSLVGINIARSVQEQEGLINIAFSSCKQYGVINLNPQGISIGSNLSYRTEKAKKNLEGISEQEITKLKEEPLSLLNRIGYKTVRDLMIEEVKAYSD